MISQTASSDNDAEQVIENIFARANDDSRCVPDSDKNTNGRLLFSKSRSKKQDPAREGEAAGKNDSRINDKWLK
jgi:hypothetical protein